MKFILHDRNTLHIEHDGEVTKWNIQDFNRNPIAASQDEYDHINAFLQYIGNRRAKPLFDTLKSIRDIFDSFGPFELKHEQLTQATTKLISLVDEDELTGWVQRHSDIPIPGSLKAEFTEQDKDPDKTYLRHEYTGLIVLVITLRLMVGVWGEYVAQNKAKLGTSYKEYSAMRLLDKSWIYSSQPIARLLRYISAWIKQNKKTEAAVMGGISSHELPVFVLSTIVVRKIAMGSLNKDLNSGGIIVSIHRQLRSMLDDLESKLGALSDKAGHKKNRSSDEEGSNWSLLELYKITQPVRTSDLVIHKFFINDTYHLGKQVDPTLPKEILDGCLKVMKTMYNYSIEEHAVKLTQWVLHRHVPARIVYNLNKEEMCKLIALSQALLWHWDFPDLALVLTAQVNRERLVAGQYSHRVKKRVKTDPMAELDKLYPYQRTNKSKPKPRDNNPAHQAISAFKDSLASSWLETHPTKFMKEYNAEMCVDERGCLIPDDLATQLAEMLVKVGNI